MKEEKRTAKQWLEKHWKQKCLYRSMLYKQTRKKMTEQEYIDIYVHPNDRWKV